MDQTGATKGAYTWGENIAAGNATAAATVEQWMNSPGHRANILNAKFTHIGVGYQHSAGSTYGHYWVQMFTGTNAVPDSPGTGTQTPSTQKPETQKPDTQTPAQDASTPEELAAEVEVSGVLPYAAAELGGNLAAQFRRGGPGVGDDEKIVHIAALLRHVAEEPVHQDPGLAGPGGGGDQETAAPVFHGGALLDYVHGCLPPSVSRSRQNSSGLTGTM